MPQNELNSNDSDLKAPLVSGGRVSTPKAIQPRIYCAPRRFDILTILCVSSVYAIAFAILTGAKVPMPLALMLTLFVTFIGLAQAILWKGERPRLASILIGILFFVAACILMLPATQYVNDPYEIFFFVMVSPFVGSIVGYVFGAAIGGLFLAIEGIRDTLFIAHKSYAPTESSSPFDD